MDTTVAGLVAGVLIAAALSGCRDEPLPCPLDATITRCRRVCIGFQRRTCAAVEVECARNDEIVNVDGLPYDCTDAERIACNLYHGLEDCFARCGEEM
jgi:hypothetical protein